MGERAHETVEADIADPGRRTLAHSERKFGDFLPQNLQNWLSDKNSPPFFRIVLARHGHVPRRGGRLFATLPNCFLPNDLGAPRCSIDAAESFVAND